MSSAALELQKAVFAALTADPALAAAVGANGVHDHAAAEPTFPYITFGRTSVYDWSTGTEDGNEHIFTLHAWSKAKGKAQALEIVESIRRVLHDVTLAMAGHRLVSLREEFEEVRYEEDHALYHGIIRFRALTEPEA